MTAKLRLIPSLDIGVLGEHAYLFDRAALHENIISVPTQRVSSRMAGIVKRIRTEWPLHEAQPYASFEALFADAAERDALAQLLRAGYLEEVPEQAPASSASSDTPKPTPTDIADTDHFKQRVVKHFFKPQAFFHLPERLADHECEVALVGVPFSSTLISSGTVQAPVRLRRDSQRAGFWFDFFAHGVYTETGCNNTMPRLLGAGTRLKDFGDVGADARTVGDLFAALGSLIETRVLPNCIRPIFIGGDHAVTFPIVDTYLRHLPNLALVHLDAHNDLFYTERVEFNHAGPILSLMAHSNLRQVHSFGLRTIGDPRVGPFVRLRDNGALDERVHLYSLTASQRWLARPQEFRAHLIEQIGADTPCYLTIDLDVLSPECIAGQTSTPAGPGMSWPELLEMVGLVTSTFDVVACDMVEFNPDHKDRPVNDERELTVLLLELIEGLSRCGKRASGNPNL